MGVFLASLNSCQKAPDNNEKLPTDNESLTLFFIPSPFGINWDSPKKLLTSMVLNYFSFRPHFMGHVAVQVSCNDLSNKKHNFITGMSAEKLNVVPPVFLEHAGLGIVFEKFPGKLDDPIKSEQEILYRLKNPELPAALILLILRLILQHVLGSLSTMKNLLNIISRGIILFIVARSTVKELVAQLLEQVSLNLLEQ